MGRGSCIYRVVASFAEIFLTDLVLEIGVRLVKDVTCTLLYRIFAIDRFQAQVNQVSPRDEHGFMKCFMLTKALLLIMII